MPKKSAEVRLGLLQLQSPDPELLNYGYPRPCKIVRFFNEAGLPKYANEIKVAVAIGYIQSTILPNFDFSLLFPVAYDQS